MRCCPILALALLVQDAPRAKEIDAAVAALAHKDIAERDKAEKQLLGIAGDAARALAALDRLRESEDEELKGRAARVREAIAERLKEAAALPGAVRAAIGAIRSAWLKREYGNVEEGIKKAFAAVDVEVTYAHYAPKLAVGDHLESDNGEEFLKFKPLGRLGGKRDLLTQEVVDALNEGEGIVGLDWERAVVPKRTHDLFGHGKCLVFTLPHGTADGKPAWSAYVVVAYRRR
jgi:hypothetical protein